jgi:single-strand DNA-binding protein
MANFNFNKVILGGRLTSDPELRSTSDATLCTNFKIAVKRTKSKEDVTDFISCTAWRNTADFIVKWFKKGSSICVIGSLHNREWTGKDGVVHKDDEVIIDEVAFVDSKSESGTGLGNASPGPSPVFKDIDPNDEDLPF